MFRTRQPLPGTAPGLLVPRSDTETAGTPIIKAVEYSEGELVERVVGSVAELPTAANPGCVLWIEINGVGDLKILQELGEKYHLHPLTLEDVAHAPQRPKMEHYDNYLFIIAQMLYRDDESRMCGEQVSMFLGKNLLITVQEDPDFDVFNPVRDRIRSGRGYIRKLGPDYLTYALLDAIIDHCFPILEAVGDALEELEDKLIENPRVNMVSTIHDYRRTLLQMRRFVWPERDVINSMLHDDSGLISKQTKVFLRDAYDHTVQIMDLVESYRDVSSGLMELYLSSTGMRTNEIMRVLTVMSSIFIPLTFIAGLYGMNFDYADGKMPFNMPELHFPHGYIGCVIIMLIVAVGQILFFKRKGWL
jgi:magnesium transporter